MTIDRTYLNEKRKALEAQRDQVQANLNAILGALQLVQLQMTDLDTADAQAETQTTDPIPFPSSASA